MTLRCGRFELSLERPLVMGVVNVTPDSFSDGGQFLDAEAAIAHARRLIDEGVDLLDVGGESTRPGAAPVCEEEELQRILPVVEALRDFPVSVDTRRPKVMRAALDAGASMINDIEALQAPGAIEAVAQSGCAVCLMHMKGDAGDHAARSQLRRRGQGSEGNSSPAASPPASRRASRAIASSPIPASASARPPNTT